MRWLFYADKTVIKYSEYTVFQIYFELSEFGWSILTILYIEMLPYCLWSFLEFQLTELVCKEFMHVWDAISNNVAFWQE